MTLIKTLNTCLCCEKTFQAGKKTAKYCSSECRDFVVKACDVCGNNFNSRRQDKTTTCSKECRATRNKWPQLGSVKQCEICNHAFTVKNARWSRTCGRKCGAALRIKEGKRSKICMPSSWQSRLKRCIADTNAKWRTYLTQCQQCGRNRATKRGRCKHCIQRLSSVSLAKFRRSAQEWLRRHKKKCRACDNIAEFQKHYCQSCLRQKRKDTHDCNHRQRCRRYGAVYHKGVTLRAVIARDGLCCHYCKCITERWNGQVTSNMTTLDHVIPISKGGGHTMSNTVVACSDCNTKKRNKVTTLF